MQKHTAHLVALLSVHVGRKGLPHYTTYTTYYIHTYKTYTNTQLYNWKSMRLEIAVDVVAPLLPRDEVG